MLNNAKCPKVQVKCTDSEQEQCCIKDLIVNTIDSFMKERFMYSFCMPMCPDSLYSLYGFQFDNTANMNLKKHVVCLCEKWRSVAPHSHTVKQWRCGLLGSLTYHPRISVWWTGNEVQHIALICDYTLLHRECLLSGWDWFSCFSECWQVQTNFFWTFLGYTAL